MKILHIDSSILGAASATRELTAATVQAWVAANPASVVARRDLAAAPLSHLDGALLQQLRPAPGAAPGADAAVAAEAAEAALSGELVAEFLAADVVVIGAPMYNFGVPSQLKAWIDRVAQPGKTFSYTATGPVGLAGGKKVIIASARGGAYLGTAFESALDHQEAYLRGVMGFFGITDVTVIRAEGLAMGPAVRESAMAQAHASVRALTGSPAEVAESAA